MAMNGIVTVVVDLPWNPSHRRARTRSIDTPTSHHPNTHEGLTHPDEFTYLRYRIRAVFGRVDEVAHIHLPALG